ncbi:MAG: hypothetical protein J6T46_02475, partial [Victivallales bacterium]|nr:hypothetical protein [Victivallales bacterium]
MKRKSIIVAAFALFATGVAYADPVTLYTKSTIMPSSQYFYLNSEVWTNSAGETVSWDAYNDGNAIACFQNTGYSASSFNMYDPAEPFQAYGLVVNYSGTWIFWDLRGKNAYLKIGAGGIDVKRSRFFFGYDDKTELQLTANQTWTGSGTSTSYERYFSVGGITGNTRYTKLVANEGVTSLAVNGKLHAALYSPDNQLGNVTVTVSDSAKLWLIDMADARLNAKKLVMDGDGVHMPFGSTFPVKAWFYPVANAYYPTNIVAIDNFHLAPEVELANGADLSAKGG